MYIRTSDINMYVNEESKYQGKQIMNSVWRNPDNGNFKIKNPFLVTCSNNLQLKQYLIHVYFFFR